MTVIYQLKNVYKTTKYSVSFSEQKRMYFHFTSHMFPTINYYSALTMAYFQSITCFNYHLLQHVFPACNMSHVSSTTYVTYFQPVTCLRHMFQLSLTATYISIIQHVTYLNYHLLRCTFPYCSTSHDSNTPCYSTFPHQRHVTSYVSTTTYCSIYFTCK